MGSEPVQKEWCVYVHTNKTNQKQYIGISCNPEKRWNKGNGYSRNGYFRNAIKKYGWDNFVHEILREHLPVEQAKQMEIKLIKEYNTIAPHGYNISEGGGHIAEITYSPEARKKQSETMKIRMKGENNPNYGRQWSDEYKEKQRLAHIGKHTQKVGTGQSIYQYSLTGAFLKKWDSSFELFNQNTGFDESALRKACKKANCKAYDYMWSYEKLGSLPPYKEQGKLVTQKDLEGNIIKIYNSASEAAREMNCMVSSIANCCYRRIQTCKGYIWDYISEDN